MPTTASGIWTPDAGDDYALTTDLAAMAASIDAATTSQLNTRFTRSGSAVTTYDSLPTSGNTAGDVRVTTDSRIIWTWDGSRWVPTAGKLPWVHAFTTADTPLGTSNVTVSFAGGGSSGAHGGTNFTVPAGCGGLYQVSFGARVTPNQANMIHGFYAGGSLIPGTEGTSGGQDWVTRTAVLDLNPGTVLTVRGRVFSGSGTIHSGSSWDISFLHVT